MNLTYMLMLRRWEHDNFKHTRAIKHKNQVIFSVTYCCYVARVELRGILQKGESRMSVNYVLMGQ